MAKNRRAAKKRTTKKRRTKSAGKKRSTRARKATAKKGRRKKTAGSRRGSLASVPTATLRAELERRVKEQERARATREELLEDLKAIERKIADLGGAVARPRGRRGPSRGQRGPGGGASLPDVLQQVLAGKTMSVAEIAEAARAAGYKSSSDKFRQIVNQTLAKNANRFKRVGRGQYTVK